MKKISLCLAMVLAVFIVGSMTAHAEERTKIDPEERFNERTESMTKRYDALLEDKEAAYQLRKANALIRQSRKLAIVKRFAPEQYEGYVTAFSDHTAVHESLHSVHTDLRTESFDTVMAGLIALKEELFPLAEAGTMTYREVHDELKRYLEEQKTAHQAAREAYAAAISDLNTQNDANKALADGLKEDLRAAIEAHDINRAKAIIAELYDALLWHIQYDQDKLDVLNTFGQ